MASHWILTSPAKSDFKVIVLLSESMTAPDSRSPFFRLTWSANKLGQEREKQMRSNTRPAFLGIATSMLGFDANFDTLLCAQDLINTGGRRFAHTRLDLARDP